MKILRKPFYFDSDTFCFTFCVRFIKSLSLSLLLGILLVIPALSQKHSYRCEVRVADFNVDDETTLGSFIVYTTKQNYVPKSFRLPNSALFINAAVLIDNDIGSAKTDKPTQMNLTLALSKKEYSRIELEMK